ncbi:uncharacterized protein LOC119108561 [Pollicipes pollicipes]|uniref:uncharacterized protein LOC119108561 n=1 Tax=Pollicipes pollicipes TaxID=41117 RepID=UPI0018856C7C|nr:uncharacterized protein LOC119108561 [Pollicipes pollicipes]
MGGRAARPVHGVALPLLVTCLVTGVASIRLLHAEIPRFVASGQHVPLSCHVLLAWGERIYAVNWYKDGREFYRHYPAEVPAGQVFHQPHLSVDAAASNVSTVLLRHMTAAASGTYRCEISTEAPLFNTVSRHGRLRVVDLPTSGPAISGGRDSYRIGDLVRLNCTSPPTVPPPTLHWYIDGERAHPDLVTRYPPVRAPDGTVTVTKQLRLTLLYKHLVATGRLNIKCTASLENIYWRSHERHVHEHVEARPARVTGRSVSNGTRPLNAQQRWRLLVATATLLLHSVAWR